MGGRPVNVTPKIPTPMADFAGHGGFRNFWSKVEKGDGCWLWDGQRTRQGYGNIDAVLGSRRNGTARRVVFPAHRVAYFLATGTDPVDKYVIHSCDNKRCVRPEHLSLGTHQQNIQEAAERGLYPSKLTEDHVRAIRILHSTGSYTQRALGVMFGVSQAAIWYVLHGKLRRHVA